MDFHVSDISDSMQIAVTDGLTTQADSMAEIVTPASTIVNEVAREVPNMMNGLQPGDPGFYSTLAIGIGGAIVLTAAFTYAMGYVYDSLTKNG